MPGNGFFHSLGLGACTYVDNQAEVSHTSDDGSASVDPFDEDAPLVIIVIHFVRNYHAVARRSIIP